MRGLLSVLLAIMLSPLAIAAQGTAPPRSPSLSLSTGGGTTSPRLGLWLPVTGRLTLGLEAQANYQTRTLFLNGDPAKEVKHHDWILAMGPAASLRVASVGPFSLSAHAGASYGVHAFDVRERLDDRSGPAEWGFGARAGLGLDWEASDHWSVGLLYQGQWTSEPGLIGTVPRDAWRGPALGLSVKFHF